MSMSKSLSNHSRSTKKMTGRLAAKSNFSDDRCDLGQFQVPIIFNGTVTPTPDQRYQLSMEIVGISANGEQLSNPSPVSKASLDVIFTTEAP